MTTTPQGLPLAVRIDPTQLAKEPAVLAAEILGLCRQAAMSSGVRLRDELVAAGVTHAMADDLQLPRADDLARAEEDDDAADDPISWLRRD